MCKLVSAAALLALLAAFAFLPDKAGAAGACTPQSARFPGCVDDIATFACRTAKTESEMLGCFSDKARELLGKDYHGDFAPGCTKMNDLAGMCSIAPSWGDGDSWCYRIDPTTVAYCDGDPPNQKCKTRACSFLQNCSPYNCGWVLVPWK